jgi:hypothetical protein
MSSSFSTKMAPEPLPKGSVREKHVENLLGLTRPPSMPTKLMERLAEQQGRGLRGEN